MMKKTVSILLAAMLAASTLLLAGCQGNNKQASAEHQPLTMSTPGIDFKNFEKVIKEKYPEIQLDFLSYTGSNGTGHVLSQLENNEIPDIYATSVFDKPQKQEENLLDLSGYSFLNNFKTADINQVTLNGSVYLIPASSNIIGLYYNKTMFKEHGWKKPTNLEELKALCQTIKQAGIDPAAAQFELPGNGFFDLFTMAKTDFLSTPEGLKWESDFKAGKATAKEGLSGGANIIQQLIDCGFLDPEDTKRNALECSAHFFNRGAAMYMNAGNITRFTQNEDGTGDQYGIMPYLGEDENNTVLITTPMRYFGISKKLAEPGNEQKLEDAMKIMELLSTSEGQLSLVKTRFNYITPLKSSEIPKDSPFYEVQDTIQSGHTSTLAYAGYVPIITDTGNKVRDWVAGKCTGDDVLALMDQLQQESLSGTIAPLAVAAETFTVEQTAQLQAQAFQEAASADVGLVSLTDYHDGIENPSGVSAKLFQGNITQEVINTIVPAGYKDPLYVLTLNGADLKAMLQSGLMLSGSGKGFPYVPAGLTMTLAADGTIKDIVMADGSPLDETKSYTIAVDQDGFTEEIGQKGNARKTELVVVDVVGKYLAAHSPLSPLQASIKR